MERLVRSLWPAAVATAVGGYALAWSWSDSLARAGNVVFWASTLAIGVAALVLARASRDVWHWLVAAAAVAAVAGASTLWSITPSATLRAAVTFGAVLVTAGFVGAVLFRTAGADERLAGALAWLAPAALALCAVVAVVGWLDADRVEGPGASGFFNGPNALGIFLALTLPFVLTRPGIWDRHVAAGAVLAAVSFTVALSGGRTGLLALLLAVVAVGVGRRRPALLARDVGVALLAVGLALVWAPGVPALGETIVAVYAEGVDPEGNLPQQRPVQELLGGEPLVGQSRFSTIVGARDEAWGEAIRLLDERPVVGHGFGTGSGLFDRYGSRDRFRFFVGAFASGTNAHNSYLELLLELGVFGGALVLAPFLLALVAAAMVVGRGATLAEGAFSATVVAAAAAAGFETILSRFGSLTLLSWLSAAAVGALWLRRRGSPAPSN